MMAIAAARLADSVAAFATIIAAGAFTVGAVVESDGTWLGLDLSELPNVPDKFKHG